MSEDEATWQVCSECEAPWQVCQECESYCCLEGMCMTCLTWTCEECGEKCLKCGAEVNV